MRRGLSALSVAATVALSQFVAVSHGVAAGNAFVTGDLHGSDNSALAGAHVLLIAWPRQAVLSRVRPGQVAGTHIVSTTVTDGAGRFALSAAASAVAADRNDNGLVNFDVVTIAGRSMTSYSFPAAAPASSASARVALLAEHAAIHMRLPVTARSLSSQGVTPDDNPYTCVDHNIHTFAPRWAIVGQTYSTSSYDNNRFYYTHGASSSLGVGVSTSGSFGSFTASGTTSFSSTLSESFPERLGVSYTYFRSEFINSDFERVCTPLHGGSSFVDGYSSRTTSYAGGTNVESLSSAPSAGDCVAEADGSDVHVHTTKAITWTNGFDTTDSIGITLSAQTGYSSEAELAYYYHHNGSLCGVSNYPGASNPYQLVAK